MRYIRILIVLLFFSGCANQTEEETSVVEEITLEENKNQVRSASENPTVIIGDWKLVWRDEFNDQNSLKNWNLQDWPADKNEELQYYSPENIKIEDGFLKLESRKERFKERDYTSGAVTTQNIFEFTYGKVEIRAKLPKGKGVFPAFWLVHVDGHHWLPEIDMMENLGHASNEIWFVVHWIDASGKKMRDYFQYSSEDTDFSDDFHLYGLEWNSDKIIWSIDNSPLFETEAFSPNVPLFLYLNTAIGGGWPGNPDPLDHYPKVLLIDYVRVFQKIEGDY